MINASLGANYSNFFVLQSLKQLLLALFNLEEKNNSKILKQKLNQFFKGEISFVYKGRDAIELCLTAYDINQKNYGVITQAFTCSAIEEGINRAGATTIYADIGNDELNLNVETLNKAKKENSNITIKAVIVQHSLGHPADIKNIKGWCKKNKILLIEDLAQSFGATDHDQQLLGSTADAIILSFGRDKVLDAVTGGAVIFSNFKADQHNFPPPTKKIILKDLSYPLLTWLIRKTYAIGFGKILHLILKKTNWFYSPVNSPTSQITSLPSYFAKLAIIQLDNLEKNTQHRKKIAKLYLDQLADSKLKLITDMENLNYGSLLRVAATTPDWTALTNAWEKQNIYLTDRWYHQPVDCGQNNCSASYQKNSCPNAEKISSQIINLPTHQQITIHDAQQIVSIIKNHAN